MKISNIFAIFEDLGFAIKSALFPTLRALWRSPSLLVRPHELSRMFMSHVWTAMGAFVDEASGPVKKDLIPKNAYGVVLDLGAAHGHTVNYLDHKRISKYVALEPNTNMYGTLRAVANAAGYTEENGTLLILSCGAEDVQAILTALNGRHSVDTMISNLTLCSVPQPAQTVAALVTDVLKPGGQLLFNEHVLSDRKDVAWWQSFWTPLWSSFFDGCKLNRPIHEYIANVGCWKESQTWGRPEEDEECLFPHKVGHFVKEDGDLTESREGIMI